MTRLRGSGLGSRSGTVTGGPRSATVFISVSHSRSPVSVGGQGRPGLEGDYPGVVRIRGGGKKRLGERERL